MNSSTNRSMLYGIVGGYLIYLAYELGKNMVDNVPTTMPRWLNILAVVAFAGIGMIGGIVYMLVHGTSYTFIGTEETVDQTFASFAYLALKAVVIACCAFIARYSPKVKWSETAEKV